MRQVGLGPIWDHTFCAFLNDLQRSCTIRDPRITRIPGVSRHNVPGPFPGGQVVAGSNPVSPTKKPALYSGFAVTFTFPQGSEVGLGTKSGTSRPSVAVWNSCPTAFVRTLCAPLHVKCDRARAETARNPSALDRWSSGRQRSPAALRGGSGSRAAGNREIWLDFNPNVDT